MKGKEVYITSDDKQTVRKITCDLVDDEDKKMEEKKFSEMSLVDFVTDILKIELEEWQKDMLRLFEENKFNKNVPIPNVYPNNPWVYPYNPTYPTDVWTDKDSGTRPYKIYYGDKNCGGGSISSATLTTSTTTPPTLINAE